MADNQKNSMYDPIQDEIKQMSETERSRTGRLHKALKLNDSIRDMPYKNYISAGGSTSLKDVIDMIQNHHQGCIIIEENDRITGIFTERDVLTKVVGKNFDLGKEKVEDHMTTDPQVLQPTDPIAYALNRMTDGGYRHVPIVDENDKPVGLVCMRTVVNYLGEFFFDEIMNLPPQPQRTQIRREDA